MCRSRFSFFDSPSDEVLKYADLVEVKLIRMRGKVGIEFKIEGGWLPDPDEPDDGVDVESFANELLTRFAEDVAKGAKGGEA